MLELLREEFSTYVLQLKWVFLMARFLKTDTVKHLVFQ